MIPFLLFLSLICVCECTYVYDWQVQNVAGRMYTKLLMVTSPKLDRCDRGYHISSAFLNLLQKIYYTVKKKSVTKCGSTFL
jgi:hypothetical protein